LRPGLWKNAKVKNIEPHRAAKRCIDTRPPHITLPFFPFSYNFADSSLEGGNYFSNLNSKYYGSGYILHSFLVSFWHFPFLLLFSIKFLFLDSSLDLDIQKSIIPNLEMHSSE
jgi:hypothetical protein